MKIFTNLPGNLRAFFGFLRFTTILMAAFWLLTLTFRTWIQNQFMDDPKLIVTVGHIILPTGHNSVGLSSDSAKSGSLGLVGLRGTLQMDLCSKDAALVSALRWTMIPSMVVMTAFALVLFSTLRNVCANIERGEVFSETNLRLVRNLGVTLIVYSLVVGVLGIWASHVMGVYLSQHVVLTGIQTNLPFPSGMGELNFQLTEGLFSLESGLVTGCLVLVVSEAFRKGLALKTESELTV